MSNFMTVNTNTIPWGEMFIEELGGAVYMKSCIDDQETGMSISKACYKAGVINKDHTHNCSHGMYVLDGILHTSRGDFGPGEFVWFPEGEVMFHGATPDNDVTFIFITNKPFDINYHF